MAALEWAQADPQQDRGGGSCPLARLPACLFPHPLPHNVPSPCLDGGRAGRGLVRVTDRVGRGAAPAEGARSSAAGGMAPQGPRRCQRPRPAPGPERPRPAAPRPAPRAHRPASRRPRPRSHSSAQALAAEARSCPLPDRRSCARTVRGRLISARPHRGPRAARRSDARGRDMGRAGRARGSSAPRAGVRGRPRAQGSPLRSRCPAPCPPSPPPCLARARRPGPEAPADRGSTPSSFTQTSGTGPQSSHFLRVSSQSSAPETTITTTTTKVVNCATASATVTPPQS